MRISNRDYCLFLSFCGTRIYIRSCNRWEKSSSLILSYTSEKNRNENGVDREIGLTKVFSLRGTLLLQQVTKKLRITVGNVMHGNVKKKANIPDKMCVQGNILMTCSDSKSRAGHMRRLWRVKQCVFIFIFIVSPITQRFHFLTACSRIQGTIFSCPCPPTGWSSPPPQTTGPQGKVNYGKKA